MYDERLPFASAHRANTSATRPKTAPKTTGAPTPSRPKAPPLTDIRRYHAQAVTEPEITDDISKFFTETDAEAESRRAPKRYTFSCTPIKFFTYWNLNTYLSPLIKDEFEKQIEQITSATEGTRDPTTSPRATARILNDLFNAERIAEARTWISAQGKSTTLPTEAFEHLQEVYEKAKPYKYEQIRRFLNKILKDNKNKISISETETQTIPEFIGTDTCTAILAWINGTSTVIPTIALQTLKEKIIAQPQLLEKISATAINEFCIFVNFDETKAIRIAISTQQGATATPETLDTAIKKAIQAKKNAMLIEMIEEQLGNTDTQKIYRWLTGSEEEIPETALQTAMQKFDIARALTAANGGRSRLDDYASYTKTREKSDYIAEQHLRGIVILLKRKEIGASEEPEFYTDTGRMQLKLQNAIAAPPPRDAPRGKAALDEHTTRKFTEAFSDITDAEKIKALQESVIATYGQGFFLSIMKVICDQGHELKTLLKQIHIYINPGDRQFSMDINLVLSRIFSNTDLNNDDPSNTISLPIDLGMQLSYTQTTNLDSKLTFVLNNVIFSGHDAQMLEILINASEDKMTPATLENSSEGGLPPPRPEHIAEYLTKQKTFINALRARAELFEALTHFLEPETITRRIITEQQKLTAKLVIDTNLAYFIPPDSELKDVDVANTESCIRKIKAECGQGLGEIISSFLNHEAESNIKTTCAHLKKMGKFIRFLTKTPNPTMGKEISNLMHFKWITHKDENNDIDGLIRYLVNKNLLTKEGYKDLCTKLKETFSDAFCKQFAEKIKTIFQTGRRLTSDHKGYEKKLYNMFKARNLFSTHASSGTFRNHNELLKTTSHRTTPSLVPH